ncbi:MAG: hydrolase [Nitrospinaceae bacterium]|nr:MAG: hydrolase [Nitrospinaceae bacterium]
MNESFKVTFRGVRGSIGTPTSSEQIEEKLNRALERAKPEDLKDASSRKAFIETLPVEIRGCFGGNTSCVHIEAGGEQLIFDAGTGIRQLGLDLLKGDFGKGQGKAHVFFTHTHWDHIQGLPFFTPLYVKGNHFTLYSPHEDLRGRLHGQQMPEYFPVPFHAYSSTLEFSSLGDRVECQIGDVKIKWMEMCHPGRSFSYRIEYNGRSVVYSTDAEYKSLRKEELQPYVDFFQNADLLIFDSMYTFGEGLEKRDWGHSSTFIGVDLAVDANVKEIAFFHHEPKYSDFKLTDIFAETKKYLKPIAPDSKLEMFLAHEGLAVDMMKGEAQAATPLADRHAALQHK